MNFLNKCLILVIWNLLELGDGWAPAVADDPTELQFFFEKNKVSTGGQNFWIGGLAYQPPESEGKL